MSQEEHPDASSYKSAGFSNKIGWGKSPALLLIDVCKAYWTENSPLCTLSNPASVASVDVMKRLLAAAREGKVPVIWTTVGYESEDMADAGIFWKKSKALDIWKKGDKRGLADWVEGLVPESGEPIITKKYPSAFFGTDLATKLTVLNVDTVVICGVSTSGCVRASTLDTMQYGYRPMVITNLVRADSNKKVVLI
jgi:nicotinamidase-related amidase